MALNCIQCMLAAYRFKMDRGRGNCSLLVAALENQVQKQGIVCEVFFLTFYAENSCFLCIHLVPN